MPGKLVQVAVVLASLGLAIILGWTGGHRQEAVTTDLPFDFYVLALSWSPAYCAGPEGSDSPSQCGPGRDFDFITHGLWPQFEDGWPSFCQSPAGDRLAPDLASRLMPVMPDLGLIAHQWEKHGTCTGLPPADYVGQVLAASASITTPPLFANGPPARLDAARIEQAFIEANPALATTGIAVTCPDGSFEEVRICLSADLSPRSCAQVDRQGCQQRALFVAD